MFQLRKFDVVTGLGGMTRPLDWSGYEWLALWIYPWTDVDNTKFALKFWNDYVGQAPIEISDVVPGVWNFVKAWLGYTERDKVTRMDLRLDPKWDEWDDGGVNTFFIDYLALIDTSTYHSINLLDTNETITESGSFNVPSLRVPLGDGDTSQSISRSSREFRISGWFVDAVVDGTFKTYEAQADEIEHMLRGNNVYLLELPTELGINTLVTVQGYGTTEEGGGRRFPYALVLKENQVRVWLE
jgi:hypothetical protein